MKSVMLCMSLLCFCSLEAAYVLKDGAFVNAQFLAVGSAEYHFNRGISALKQKNWDEASLQFRTVLASFPSSALTKEATYFLGVALYEDRDFELAHTTFTEYLHKDPGSSRFEDVYRYKLAIAQKFAHGYRRHLFGIMAFPRLSSGEDLALEIFDEIASIVPNQELAAVALQEKAALLSAQESISEAIDTYETILRRFPHSQHALRAYIFLSHCYAQQIAIDPHNVDAITMAEINKKEFIKHFPQSTQISLIEHDWHVLQTTHAQALFDTGRLYEKKGNSEAAKLYYTYTQAAFAHLPIAQQCATKCKELSCAPSPSV